MTKLLQIIDLFSGIGGFSYSFSALGSTTLYCEIDPVAGKVLQSNKCKGLISNAPTHNDVHSLNLSDYKLDTSHSILIGGFPCIGFSSAGKRKGFGNAQSNLFNEMLQIIKTNSIPYLFFENEGNRLYYKSFI